MAEVAGGALLLVGEKPSSGAHRRTASVTRSMKDLGFESFASCSSACTAAGRAAGDAACSSRVTAAGLERVHGLKNDGGLASWDSRLKVPVGACWTAMNHRQKSSPLVMSSDSVVSQLGGFSSAAALGRRDWTYAGPTGSV
jgi:hypothetical protein